MTVVVSEAGATITAGQIAASQNGGQVVRVLPLLDAKRLAGTNAATLTRMQQDQFDATEAAQAAEHTLNAANTDAFDIYLGPFAAQFARIKNVELDELPVVSVVPEFGRLDIEIQKVAIDAFHGLSAVAGGGALGAAVGAGTFAAVGALATASTGAAIGGLSGAAATSATLAWLGGGSLAAGGGGVAAGTAMLASTVAAPLVLVTVGFVHWQGVRAHRRQLEQQEELLVADAALQLQIARSDAASTRALDTASVLTCLAAAGRSRLPELCDVLDRTEDYRRFDDDERRLLATLVGIATTTAAVIAAPVLDADGTVSALSTDTVTTAQSLLDRLIA